MSREAGFPVARSWLFAPVRTGASPWTVVVRLASFVIGLADRLVLVPALAVFLTLAVDLGASLARDTRLAFGFGMLLAIICPFFIEGLSIGWYRRTA
jgi:hypothetical protein